MSKKKQFKAGDRIEIKLSVAIPADCNKKQLEEWINYCLVGILTSLNSAEIDTDNPIHAFDFFDDVERVI